MAEAPGNFGARTLGNLPYATKAQDFGVIVNAQLGELIASGRQDMHPADPLPATKLADETHGAGISLIRSVGEKHRKIQPHVRRIRHGHELASFLETVISRAR